MSVFNSYARYYDLLYKDKSYEEESNYIQGLIQKYAPKAGSILELGCGTGIHASLLAKEGYEVHGVDQSHEMLALAAQRIADVPSAKLSFAPGDIRTVRTGKQFDVVISMFHVMSYQITNEDLSASFETARVHLNPGGVFIFDCWYGPAVLTQKPSVRVKRLEDGRIRLTRIAEPEMHPAENRVDVNYHMFVMDKETGNVEEIHEVHRMRYLFTPEIELILSNHGLSLVNSFEWLSDNKPGFTTWGVCFVVRI